MVLRIPNVCAGANLVDIKPAQSLVELTVIDEDCHCWKMMGDESEAGIKVLI